MKIFRLATTLELFNTVSHAQRTLRESLRERRVTIGWTQAGLAERSGVSLSTLRKYEQQGVISLESFLKLLDTLGVLDEVLEVTKPPLPLSLSGRFVRGQSRKPRQRGSRR